MNKRNKYLTWDDLADLYHKRTGGQARVKPMDIIFEWATTQQDITETKNGLIINSDTK